MWSRDDGGIAGHSRVLAQGRKKRNKYNIFFSVKSQATVLELLRFLHLPAFLIAFVLPIAQALLISFHDAVISSLPLPSHASSYKGSQEASRIILFSLSLPRPFHPTSTPTHSYIRSTFSIYMTLLPFVHY